jgi:hypothetical protein
MKLPRDLSGAERALRRAFDYECTRQAGSHRRLTTLTRGRTSPDYSGPRPPAARHLTLYSRRSDGASSPHARSGPEKTWFGMTSMLKHGRPPAFSLSPRPDKPRAQRSGAPDSPSDGSEAPLRCAVALSGLSSTSFSVQRSSFSISSPPSPFPLPVYAGIFGFFLDAPEGCAHDASRRLRPISIVCRRKSHETFVFTPWHTLW